MQTAPEPGVPERFGHFWGRSGLLVGLSGWERPPSMWRRALGPVIPGRLIQRTRGSEVVKVHLAVTIVIEPPQGLRCLFQLIRGKDPVMIEIERNHQWRGSWPMGFGRAFLFLLPGLGCLVCGLGAGFLPGFSGWRNRWRGHHFVAGQPAVAVPVEGPECGGGAVDLPAAQRAVFVGIEGLVQNAS